MSAKAHDTRPCTLGEGPLWHPLRKQLFWFDIHEQKMLSQTSDGAPLEWLFDAPVSAAGWIDETALLIASSTALTAFDLRSNTSRKVADLEADNDATRSNDGRADPWGGFWIGTMGRQAQTGAGAIYRFFDGQVHQLFDSLTIPNAIAFSPDMKFATFADTATQRIMRTALDTQGWPTGEAAVFADLRTNGLNPDGAVFDAEGRLWVALWGAGCVMALRSDGSQDTTIKLPALHTTCPAFGGETFDTLYVTSAQQGLSASVLEDAPKNGMTFAQTRTARGLAEPRVRL